MMKKFYNIIFILLFVLPVYPQQASDFFPNEPGYKWNYRVVPLDSMNNEINELTFFRADSFANVTNFEGKTTDLVLTKQGPDSVIQIIPYTDTLYFSFEEMTGYEYIRLPLLTGLAGILDSISPGAGTTLLEFFESIKGWYSTYRFDAQVNQSYTLFQKDTIIVIDSLSLPIRFQYAGTRLNDELLETELGIFDCKKFLLALSVLIRPLPPPFPFVELLQIPDSVWIAPEHWIVKDFIPSVELDLQGFGLGVYNIPGFKTEILSITTDIRENNNIKPLTISLKQNYPNPFNPITRINFILNKEGFVTIKVYNILGNEIAELINDEYSAGEYSIDFDASSGNPSGAGPLTGRRIASGVYFYKIIFTDRKGYNYSETKQMLLLK